MCLVPLVGRGFGRAETESGLGGPLRCQESREATPSVRPTIGETLPELPIDLFGTSPRRGYVRTWDNVRQTLAVYLTRRFHHVSPEEVDDVVSSVMCDLIEKWVTYPSSISEDKQKNWNFAMRYCRWRGNERLFKRIQAREQEVGLDDYISGDPDHPQLTYGDLADIQEFGRVSTEPSEASIQRMQAFLDSIDQSDLDGWIVPMVEGESVRDQAEREGKRSNYPNVYRRRKNGVKRLYRRAVEMGVYKA